MNDFLPASVRLPFGYTILIKAVAPRTLKRLAQGDEVFGLWVNNGGRLIYVDKSLTEPEQRYILTHELGHGWLDWQHWALMNSKRPMVRARP